MRALRAGCDACHDDGGSAGPANNRGRIVSPPASAGAWGDGGLLLSLYPRRLSAGFSPFIILVLTSIIV